MDKKRQKKRDEDMIVTTGPGIRVEMYFLPKFKRSLLEEPERREVVAEALRDAALKAGCEIVRMEFTPHMDMRSGACYGKLADEVREKPYHAAYLVVRLNPAVAPVKLFRAMRVAALLAYRERWPIQGNGMLFSSSCLMSTSGAELTESQKARFRDRVKSSQKDQGDLC